MRVHAVDQLEIAWSCDLLQRQGLEVTPVPAAGWRVCWGQRVAIISGRALAFLATVFATSSLECAEALFRARGLAWEAHELAPLLEERAA